MPLTKKRKAIQQELKNLNAVELMNFVSDKYHTSEKRNLSSLNQCFQFMPALDTNNHPELSLIRSHFNDVRKLLQKHVTDSETIYFPAIKKNNSGNYDFSSLQNQLHSIHSEISILFQKIQSLTNHFTPPPETSGWTKLCYALLHDLESDVYFHLFVEENILPLKLRVA